MMVSCMLPAAVHCACCVCLLPFNVSLFGSRKDWTKDSLHGQKKKKDSLLSSFSLSSPTSPSLLPLLCCLVGFFLSIPSLLDPNDNIGRWTRGHPIHVVLCVFLVVALQPSLFTQPSGCNYSARKHFSFYLVNYYKLNSIVVCCSLFRLVFILLRYGWDWLEAGRNRHGHGQWRGRAGGRGQAF